MKRSFFGALLACAVGCANVETEPAPPAPAVFPDDWVGQWAGECRLLGPEGERMRFRMELEIGPMHKGRGSWRVTYGEGEDAQVRPYELLTVDAAAGHYAIDEHNGIVLDSYVRGGAFYSAFSMQGNLLLARYECVGDDLHVEIATVDEQAERENELPRMTVKAFPMKAVQRGVLRRVTTASGR